MKIWIFYDYCDIDGGKVGKNRVDAWYDSLPAGRREAVRGKVEYFITTLEVMKDWQVKSGKWIKQYTGLKGIYELRPKVKKVQYRIFGCYGPSPLGERTFVLLWGAIEKDGKIHGGDLGRISTYHRNLMGDVRHAQPHLVTDEE